jgi:hypothetical protein
VIVLLAVLTRSDASPAQLALSQQALQEARQSSASLQDLKTDMAALKTLLDSRPPSRDLEGVRADTGKIVAEAAALNTRLTALASQVTELRAALDRAKPEGDGSALVAAAAQKVSRELQELIDRNFAGRLTNLQTQVNGLASGLSAVSRQLERDGTPQDVALLLVHAHSLDARKLLPVVEELALKELPRATRRGYRLGVFVVADNKLDDPPLLRLEAPVPGQPGASTELKPLGDPSDSIEEVDKLDPNEMIFRKAKSTAGPWQRRCVLVVSCACPPPAADSPRWKDVAVDVVLLDTLGGARGLKTFDDWAAFARAHRGLAVLVPAPKGPDPAGVKPVLQRLLAPS